MIARVRLVTVACGLLAFGCAVGLVRVLSSLGLRIPLDPNEGWNAYHAQAAMTAGSLYPSSDSFLFNNHPPLSFYLVGAFGRLAGDNIVAGRIVSLLALAAIGAGIFASLRLMKVGASNAIFAVLTFIAGLLVFTDYVGMNDPQLLGHAVDIAGLVILLRAPRTARTVCVAALVMVLACFIKHNLIALPLAAAIWLAIFDRRNALHFAAPGVVFALLGLVIFRITFGVELFGQLASPRLYSLATLEDSVCSFLIWCGLPLVASAVLFGLRRSDRYVAFCALYALMAVIVGTGFSGGAGVDLNVWFEAAIALSLLAGLALDRLATWTPGLVIAFLLPLWAGLIPAYDSEWLERNFWLHPFAEESESARRDIAFLKAQNGPVACEMLSLCYWAGKKAEIDVFNLGQAYATQARSDDDLIRLIEGRHYAALEFDSLTDFALGARVRKALLGSYRIDHQDETGVFLVPRQTASALTVPARSSLPQPTEGPRSAAKIERSTT